MDPPFKRLTLPAISQFVRGGALAAGVAENEFGKLDLILEEILVNVARYAYSPESGAVEVAYTPVGPHQLRVEIADFGRVFNPLQADPPDLSRGLAERPIGGLGVFLVRSMVDSIAYRREGDRNVLSFTFPLDRGDAGENE
jgi:anti-sigma regulatory factor (Ser/Thr protein kinase)